MNNIKIIFGTLLLLVMFSSCQKDEALLTSQNPMLIDETKAGNPFFNSTDTWMQEDQMGRPAINTVLVSSGSKDQFNTTIPSEQFGAFQSMMQNNLEGLSPAFNDPSDTNVLGLTSEAFTGILASDVLNLSLDGTTTFFDGVNLLTGRALADDVITVELILIFGGEDGLANPEFPGLTDDHVDANDKPFLNNFPYLASPW